MTTERATPPRKRKLEEASDRSHKVYNFKVLLPNGTSVMVAFHNPQPQMSLQHFLRAVRDEYQLAVRHTATTSSTKRRRDVNWTSDQLRFLNAEDRTIQKVIRFENDYDPDALHILRLCDGSSTVPDTYENMWDLTPDTDLLMELPQEYSFEAALSELIDNSLQAVWGNVENERRLISVEVDGDKISVFDTGPGMDASGKYSIVNWGKMGASLHRKYKCKTSGRNIRPPYLEPLFGMFGYGGFIASMHLGRRALVSSKRKDSPKVFSLNLEREALLNKSRSGGMWKTDGGLRDPLEIDIKKSPHRSFTKVEIYRLKMKSLNISELRCRLKDIYFPYIQCDELSSVNRTATPVEFEVNGLNLAEVAGGESAVTNWFSCNGHDFVFQVRLHVNREDDSMETPGRQTTEEANARLKCVYFPMKEGKESIDMILEKLNSEESFTKFSRVSIRRLGRLLPDARWPWLPFMDLRQKKGDRAQIVKRCCMRVKCFIDTDGGFSPTRSKTDLVHHHAFTTALKSFGDKSQDKDKEVNIDISQSGKSLSISRLHKEYLKWICDMHDMYDDENEFGDDEPVIVVTPNKKQLGISSDVVRVHQEIRKNGKVWKSGQKIKILKGACAGCHNSNVYATLERIVLGGFEGDPGGESRLLCRPIALRDDEGCVLEEKDGVPNLDLRKALSVPLNVIDSKKCVAVETSDWNFQLAKLYEKAPSSIEMLNERHCQDLDIDGVLPIATAISAGQTPPQEVVVVIRPKCFTPSVSNPLEQKYIVNDGSEMSMEVKFSANGEDFAFSDHLYSVRRHSSTRRGLDGLYIFPIASKLPNDFTKAGRYMFSFVIKNSDIKPYVAKVDVYPSPMATEWKVSSEIEYPWKLRIGQYHPNFDLTCHDEYGNRIPFGRMPKVDMTLNLKGNISCRINTPMMELSQDKFIVHFKDVTIESNELDQIRPNYEAKLVLCSPDALFSVTIPCQVIPGPLKKVQMLPKNFGDDLYPGCVIQQLELEVPWEPLNRTVVLNMSNYTLDGIDYEFFDAYGNHALGGSVEVVLDGCTFQDTIGSKREIDEHGCLNLSGILKVTAEHGQTISISFISESEVINNMTFQTKRRNLALASEVRTGSAFIPMDSISKDKVIQLPSMDNENINYKSVDDKCFAQAIINSIQTKEEELLEDVLSMGKKIGVIEKELNSLQIQREEIEQDMLALQELQSNKHFNSSPESKQLMNVIKNKKESAASLVYNLRTRETHEEPMKSFMADVVGIVSELGALPSEELSRILAEFLGEDQMLAVVCRTDDAASALLKCQDGDAGVTALGNSNLRRFDVICLEDIRPFAGGSVPCDYLALRNPTLTNGDSPAGFLGYAVNLVYLETANGQIRTRTGHGLRETLFYRLFGELQVYETIDQMKQASACGCLNQTAVSLDGGIARGNGVFTYAFGHPEVYFPVVTLENPHLSQDEQEILKKMEDKKMELISTHDRIMWLTELHRELNKMFKRKNMLYNNFIDQNGQLLREGRLFLEYKISSSSNSS